MNSFRLTCIIAFPGKFGHIWWKHAFLKLPLHCSAAEVNCGGDGEFSGEASVYGNCVSRHASPSPVTLAMSWREGVLRCVRGATTSLRTYVVICDPWLWDNVASFRMLDILLRIFILVLLFLWNYAKYFHTITAHQPSACVRADCAYTDDCTLPTRAHVHSLHRHAQCIHITHPYTICTYVEHSQTASPNFNYSLQYHTSPEFLNIIKIKVI